MNIKPFSLILACYIFINIQLVILIANTTTYAHTIKHTVPSSIKTSLVVDGRTGKILHEYNARKQIYPASLTKVMTIYLIFEAIERGRLSLDQKLYVSSYATTAHPLKLYLKHREHITVRDTILGLIVKSANDVARVAAESIAGSEKQFAKLMTSKAHHLGMHNTTFTNASGLHDPRQVSTAIDLAKLSIAIKRDFPQYYHLFKRTSFKFRKKIIKGHNRIVATYPGAEGLKTGFTTPAGCNLITTATRGNKSLVAIVTGRSSPTIRNNNMVKLLDTYFELSTNSVKKVQRYNCNKIE